MTEAIRKAVALIDELRPLAEGYECTLSKREVETLIAALEDMQGVADGTHVVVPTQALPDSERRSAWASLQMVGDAIEELFGPIASLESEEGTLHRGPEYHHRAEGIIEALQRIRCAMISKAQEK
jgi:hypothetical protein